MALLRAVWTLKELSGGRGRVHALHVNHQLRGEESEADARWCEDQCESLGVELRVLAGSASARAASGGDGLEAAARSERYQLLTCAAEQLGARYLATAHTRDDQAETVFFRILRGSGLRGLSGIPRSRKLTPALTLVRPLLACSRELLRRYLHSLGQTSREDSSNLDLQFTRNRLRHDLLPKLRAQYNSNLDSALVNLARQAEEAEQLIEQLAQQLLEESTINFRQGPQSDLFLEFGSNVEFASPVARAALRHAWREANLPEQDMTYQWWARLASLLENESGEKYLNLPGGVYASVEQGKLRLQWSTLSK